MRYQCYCQIFGLVYEAIKQAPDLAVHLQKSKNICSCMRMKEIYRLALQIAVARSDGIENEETAAMT